MSTEPSSFLSISTWEPTDGLMASVTIWRAGNRARMISTKLSALQKTIMLSASYPATHLNKLTANQNICYNVLFFKNYFNKSSSDNYATPSDLEGILEGISRNSGGVTTHTTNIEDGLKKIAHHQDNYYELTYLFDNKIEDKKLKVRLLRKKPKTTYRSSFTGQELKAMVKHISRGKVGVDGFAYDKHRISFSVKNLTNTEYVGRPGDIQPQRYYSLQFGARF